MWHSEWKHLEKCEIYCFWWELFAAGPAWTWLHSFLIGQVAVYPTHQTCITMHWHTQRVLLFFFFFLLLATLKCIIIYKSITCMINEKHCCVCYKLCLIGILLRDFKNVRYVLYLLGLYGNRFLWLEMTANVQMHADSRRR